MGAPPNAGNRAALSRADACPASGQLLDRARQSLRRLVGSWLLIGLDAPVLAVLVAAGSQRSRRRLANPYRVLPQNLSSGRVDTLRPVQSCSTHACPPQGSRSSWSRARPRLSCRGEALGDARASGPELAAGVVAFWAGGGIGEPPPADLLPVKAEPEADPSAPVLILVTSGTTGTPKGAVMTGEALAANVVVTAVALGMTGSHQILTFTTMFHIAELNPLTTPALFAGATASLIPEGARSTPD